MTLRFILPIAGLVCVLLLLGCGALYYYMLVVPGRPHQGPLPALTAEEQELAPRLKRHIDAIASVPHNVTHYDDLEKAALYIERTLEGYGHIVERQLYTVDGKTFRNISVTIAPQFTTMLTELDPARHETIVIGAHYDSAGDAPGANDNGTGVAAVLELSRLLADLQRKAGKRIRLVLFVNEERPYAHGEDMGSLRYAQMLKDIGERVTAMISLETIGFFSEEPGTQRYPKPFDWVFDTRGNFIAFVGTLESRRLVHDTIRSFRSHTPFPTIGGVAPGFIPGIDWSDHWSFAKVGYPAIMVTDTAPFRYPHYHKVTDTPDKIDTEKLARITKGMERVIRATM
jgi:hypothetical protein